MTTETAYGIKYENAFSGAAREGFCVIWGLDMHNAITDVPRIKVGHYSDREDITGCTVVLYKEGSVAGVDVHGAAPGTRETDLLRSIGLVAQAHAILGAISAEVLAEAIVRAVTQAEGFTGIPAARDMEQRGA